MVHMGLEEYYAMEGRLWFFKTTGTLNADGDTLTFGFMTGDTEVWAYFGFGSQDEYKVEIFEAPAIADTGSVLTMSNAKRSAGDGPLTAYSGPTFSGEAPTAFWSHTYGSGRGSTGPMGLFYIITPKKNTFYAFKLTHQHSQPGYYNPDFFYIKPYQE